MVIELVNNFNPSMELLTLLVIFLLVSFVVKKVFVTKIRNALPKDLDDLFKGMDRFCKKDFIKIRMLHKNVIFLNNPKLIHKVLSSDVCLEKPQLIYRLLCINAGLLTSKCKSCRLHNKQFHIRFRHRLTMASRSSVLQQLI